MLKVKIVAVTKLAELEPAINDFIATLDEEAIKDISIDITKGTAIIQYVAQEEWRNHICADCKYWDDGGSPSAVGGLCHECGTRRRFNCKACKSFKDIREV